MNSRANLESSLCAARPALTHPSPLGQALSPELAEDEETPAQAAWREAYTSARLPAPRLGPVAVKAFPGGADGMRAAAPERARRGVGGRVAAAVAALWAAGLGRRDSPAERPRLPPANGLAAPAAAAAPAQARGVAW